MSRELDQAREIAERIARRVSGDSHSKPSLAHANPEVGEEIAAVRAGISELQRKLTQLEAKVSSDSTEHPRRTNAAAADSRMPQKPVLITHSPWLAGINASYSHPSQEKFGVEEATVTELVDFFEKEKICNVEPGGKPCDHCAMCSSRGF
ncbi:MAG: hypothetical protein ACR2HX_15175 [Pyrinomonadaceae bacterium]